MNDNIPALVNEWAVKVGFSDDAIAERALAVELLTYDAQAGWVQGDAAAVTELAAALLYRGISAISSLSGLEALSLASACYRHEIAPGPAAPRNTPAVTTQVQRALVRCFHERTTDTTEQELLRRTVFHAVRDLGGASSLSLPDWVGHALGDAESDWYLSDDHLKRIALACANRSPGRRWTRVIGLGYITWTLRVQPYPVDAVST